MGGRGGAEKTGNSTGGAESAPEVPRRRRVVLHQGLPELAEPGAGVPEQGAGVEAE